MAAAGRRPVIDRTEASAGRLDAAWLLFWGLASSLWLLTAAAHLGPTFDEPLYLSQGLEFWRTGSHYGMLRLGTMPLPLDVQALPLHLAELWRGRPWQLPEDFDLLLPWFRAGTLPFWWLLLAYALLAGRRLGGHWGGRLAVAVLACEPNFLAHAGLGTTDIAVTAALLAFVYHFRLGRGASWPWRVGVPMALYGVLLLAKASGLVFGPLAMLAVELERLARRPDRPPWSSSPAGLLAFLRACRSALRGLRDDGLAICFGGLALTFLYCGCEFRAQPSWVAWAHGLPAGAGRDVMVFLSENVRLFGNAGEGLVRQIKHNMQGHGTYLLGADFPRAVWWYFPVLLTIKLPLPPLLVLLGVALTRPRGLVNWATAAAALLLANSLGYRVQIGIRFLLPALALLAVGLSAAVAHAVRSADWPRRRALAGLAAGAVLWLGGEAAGVWPDGLRYVNALWGGSRDGYRLVNDSNYDWSQGLRELAAWREAEPEPVAVWYFGTDPALTRLPLQPVFLHLLTPEQADDLPHHVPCRLLAVNVTLIYGTPYSETHRRLMTELRARRPAARTGTFLIFDLAEDARAEGRP